MSLRRIFISYLPTPGSQIYKDAVILSKVVQSKAADCVTALAGRQSSGGRQVFSAEIAATKYESDEDHAELPEWSLFRQKVSIETILQKLVPIWSLFAPKSLDT